MNLEASNAPQADRTSIQTWAAVVKMEAAADHRLIELTPNVSCCNEMADADDRQADWMRSQMWASVRRMQLQMITRWLNAHQNVSCCKKMGGGDGSQDDWNGSQSEVP